MINTEIIIDETTTKSIVTNEIKEAIKNYLLELRKTWEATEEIVIRKSKIDTIILNTNGVIDVSNTSINQTIGNLVIENDKIPVLSEVIVE